MQTSWYCTFLLVLACTAAQGQHRIGITHHTTGDDFLVNDDTTGGNANQVAPCIAMDGSGNMVIAWVDSRSLDQDIYFQYFDSTGAAQGPNRRVNDDEGMREQTGPEVAVNDRGDGAIVWFDHRLGERQSVFLQRFGPGGKLEGPNLRVSDESGKPYGQDRLAVATNASGDMAIAWNDFRNGDEDIYLQRYDADGTPVGGNVLVNDDGIVGCYQYSPSVDMNDSGQLVLIWQDYRNGRYQIYLQRFDKSGARVGGNSMVSDTLGIWGQVLISDSGRVAVVWNSRAGVGLQRFAPSGSRLGGNTYLKGIAATRLVRWSEGGNTVFLGADDHYTYSILTLQCYDPDAVPIIGRIKLQDHPSYDPAIALDMRGGGTAVSTVDCNSRDNYQIYDLFLQRFDASGATLLKDRLVNDDVGTSNQENPGLALNDLGAAAIVWEDYRSAFRTASSENPLRSDIYLQLYGPSGVPRGMNILVSDSSDNRGGQSPCAAMNGAGNTVVAWTVPTGYTTPFGEGQVYLRRIGPDGVSLGMITLVADSTSEGPRPSVAFSDSGGIVVSWTMTSHSGSRVYLQRFDRLGEQTGGRVLVNDTLNEQGGLSHVVMNASGTIAVVWRSLHEGWGTYSRIHLQQFRENGARAGPARILDECSGEPGLSITMNNSGDVAVIWTRWGSGGQSDTVFIQYFNPSGIPRGSKSVVTVVNGNSDFPSPDVMPSVSMDDSGNAVVLWTAETFGGASADIMGQRLLPFGVKVGEPFCVPMSEGPHDFQRKTAISLTARRVLCAWEDNRRLKGRDIYGDYATFVWNPLVPVNEEGSVKSGQFALEQNYPNPFNPRTTIKFELPRASHVTLTVYDILGREVATLVNANEEPGYKSVEWNAVGVASGVYFYRLTAGDLSTGSGPRAPSEVEGSRGFVQTRKLLLMR